jgi:DNA-binding NarL/FixJ family response regulator
VKNMPEIAKTRILIADDHQLINIALRKIFEECPDFEVIADAADGEEAVKLAERLKPDIIIMDISMPKMNGLEATRKIKTANPDILILVLTVHSDDEHIFGIIEAGADGYLIKSGLGEGIVHSVRDLITGKTVLSSSILKQLVERVLRHPVTPAPVIDATLQGKITSREHEILVLAARGMTNKDIAMKLNVSPLTVKNYIVGIFNKLGAHSRTDAVITGLKLGIIGLKDL